MSSLTPSAAKRGATSASSTSTASLREKLAGVLPQGHNFGIHHISTPPTRSEPLCVAPPGQRPDKTYRESHFLAISIHPYDSNSVPSLKRASPGADRPKETATRKPVIVFAIEILIFTTAYQTTVFVSKADSTGFLQLLNLPAGTPSPIRQVCAAFLAYLLDHRKRKNVQTVVNLFARAQAQYLFPGSVHNKGKHVLDDWGLVRWWCRVLNPLMEGLSKEAWGNTKGYLLVPGLEEMEMRAFIPRTAASTKNWAIGHPLQRISHYTYEFDWVPPRCLIPGYPDDPKSRFRDELDEEVSKKKQDVTAWKSVKSLEQFWEMMAYRQECSSGRLTGFIWLVFDPKETGDSFWGSSTAASEVNAANPSASFDSSLLTAPATPPRKRAGVASRTPQPSPVKRPFLPPAPGLPPTQPSKKKAKKKLTGRIVPRAPKIKTQARNYTFKRPTTTAYYHWPPEGRGSRIVGESEYRRIVELLLHLDFATLDKTASSSQRWLKEVGLGEATEAEVQGKAPAPDVAKVKGPVPATFVAGGNVTNLTGLIRRKVAQTMSEPEASRQSSSATEPQNNPAGASGPPATKQVNVLGVNLVRKKKET
ncbi:hypothetical protein N0V88_007872 [Collariella sp. IMI 366227]|nr:hypothetical protein N0V88_007872 [Collariella sp. IMI 366227]